MSMLAAGAAICRSILQNGLPGLPEVLVSVFLNSAMTVASGDGYPFPEYSPKLQVSHGVVRIPYNRPTDKNQYP